MTDAGSSLMGIGQARGEDRASEAAQRPRSRRRLLEASIDGARGVLLNIAGGSDLGLFEVNEAAGIISQAAHQDANIIFGAVVDDTLGDEVRVTVIAAGFDRWGARDDEAIVRPDEDIFTRSLDKSRNRLCRSGATRSPSASCSMPRTTSTSHPSCVTSRRLRSTSPRAGPPGPARLRWGDAGRDCRHDIHPGGAERGPPGGLRWLSDPEARARACWSRSATATAGSAIRRSTR